MSKSQNGWPVLPYGSPQVHRWVIPAKTGRIKISLRYGSAGFLLAHFLLWWAEVIEPLVGRIVDDWGHGIRPVRDSDDTSNHASATAADSNALQHPLGVYGTLTKAERAKIWIRLKVYQGCLRHGAFYVGRVDPMHVEIDKPLPQVERVARQLMKTPRGKRILAANPGQRQIILS